MDAASAANGRGCTGPPDGAAPAPIFSGDPDLSPPAPNAFNWREFQKGSGEFSLSGGGNSSSSSSSPSSPWKFIASTSKDGVNLSVHSRPVDGRAGGLCEFMLRGVLPMPRDVYFALNADMEHRAEWDSTTTCVSEISRDPERHTRILHWEVKYPWPLGRRDYVLEQSAKTERGDGSDAALLRCLSNCTLPERECSALRPLASGITRIDVYRSHMGIWAGKSANEANFALLYFEDSKMSVPSWLVSKIAASTIPSSLAAAVPVSKKYPSKRLHLMLRRFCPGEDHAGSGSGNTRDRADSGRSIGAGGGGGGESDAESFYSASDEEACGDEVELLRNPRHSGRAQASASASAVAQSPTGGERRVAFNDGKGGVGTAKLHRLQESPKPAAATASALPPKMVGLETLVEEGLLILSREERELLLEVLSETKARRATSWWLPAMCCACRRRVCGRKDRHKL